MFFRKCHSIFVLNLNAKQMKSLKLIAKSNGKRYIECYSIENNLIATVYEDLLVECSNRSFLSVREIDHIHAILDHFDLFFENIHLKDIPAKYLEDPYAECSKCDTDLETNNCLTCSVKNQGHSLLNVGI